MPLSFPDVPPGNISRLFEELHALYREANDPTLRFLGREVGCSHETVRKAFVEPSIPTWGLLVLIVEQLSRMAGRDVQNERDRFRSLRIAAREEEDIDRRQSKTPSESTSSLSIDMSNSTVNPKAGVEELARYRPSEQVDRVKAISEGRKKKEDKSVLRHRIGRELRRLRKASGWSLEQASDGLEVDVRKLRRIESGSTKVTMRDARDLLVLYGAGEVATARLSGWVQEAKIDPWWSGVEDLASDITGYQLSLEEHSSKDLQFDTDSSVASDS